MRPGAAMLNSRLTSMFSRWRGAGRAAAAAMKQRPGEYDARAGGHFRRHRKLLELEPCRVVFRRLERKLARHLLLSPSMAAGNDGRRAVLGGESIDCDNGRQRNH